MAFSRVSYTGTGSVLNATFPFPYLDRADINVFVNDVSVPFTFLNTSTVTPTVAPAAGSIVQVRRMTQKTSVPVNFTDGSVLLEQDLDLLGTYSLYLAQETQDGVDSALRANFRNEMDARGLRIVNVAPGTQGSDAANTSQVTAVADYVESIVELSVLASLGHATAAALSEFNAGTSAAAAEQSAIDSRRFNIFNPRGSWATATSYALRDLYTVGGIAYVTTLAHTSTSVAADLAAGKVTVHQGATKEELAAAEGSGLVGNGYGVSPGGVSLPVNPLTVFARSSPIPLKSVITGGAMVTDASINYSAQLQAVINYLRDFGGGKIILPPNTRIQASNLILYSGIEIIGHDWTTVIEPVAGAYGLSVNPGTGGTTDPEANQRNLALRGFKVLGKVAASGFSEHVHLLNFNAASWCEIEGMQIAGFQGDGFYIGSSNAAATERHNKKITVTRSLFDGINSDNRNGISIIDGDGIVIEKSQFRNISRVGMPGCIDCEPDANAYAIVRNIEINSNLFTGGNEAAIALLLRSQSTLTTPHENFKITGNEIRTKKGLTFSGEVAALSGATVPYGVLVQRNLFKDNESPFIIDGARGLTLADNTIEDSQYPAELGYTVGNYGVVSTRNMYRRLGKHNTLGTRGLYVRNVTGLTLDGDTFEDCGRADGTAGRSIEFVSGSSGSHIAVRNTTFSSPTGKTNYVIFAAGYTFDNGTCEDFNNKYLFGSANDFVANLSNRFTAAPTTGTWYALNEVYATKDVLNTTGVTGWECTLAGTPGTWEVKRLAPFRRMVSRNYAATENFSAALFDIFSINIQANPALTYNAPTGGTVGQEITIRVKNASGGAMGVITWNAAFKMSGWTNPANGKSRAVTFVYDGASWVEISQTAADVAN